MKKTNSNTFVCVCVLNLASPLASECDHTVCVSHRHMAIITKANANGAGYILKASSVWFSSNNTLNIFECG